MTQPQRPQYRKFEPSMPRHGAILLVGFFAIAVFFAVFGLLAINDVFFAD